MTSSFQNGSNECLNVSTLDMPNDVYICLHPAVINRKTFKVTHIFIVSKSREANHNMQALIQTARARPVSTGHALVVWWPAHSVWGS